MENVALDLIFLDRAKEQVMLKRIFDNALCFYKNPDNIRAFEAWQKNREESQHDTNYINA